MPKLPVVRSRQSRVSGHPSQVAGALIPDNTQHSWRDDAGKALTVRLRAVPYCPLSHETKIVSNFRKY